jgi:hypothetical protein
MQFKVNPCHILSGFGYGNSFPEAWSWIFESVELCPQSSTPEKLGHRELCLSLKLLSNFSKLFYKWRLKMETSIYFRQLCFQQRISLRMKLDFCTVLAAWKAMTIVRLLVKLVLLFVLFSSVCIRSSISDSLRCVSVNHINSFISLPAYPSFFPSSVIPLYQPK